MHRFLPELAALALLPYLIFQGRRTRRLALRLPEASGPAEGLAGASHGTPPLSLLAIGESTVAGVGVSSYEQAIGGQFAITLAERVKRPVRWRACGKNGVTISDAMEVLLPCVPEQHVDLVLLCFGVNDTTSFRSVARWEKDVSTLLAEVRRRCSPEHILISGVPPMAALPVLPQPLRYVMGMKARSLDASLRRIAAGNDAIVHVPLALDLRNASFLACDGYHPSPAGCAAWAELLADACLARLARTGAPSSQSQLGEMPVR